MTMMTVISLTCYTLFSLFTYVKPKPVHDYCWVFIKNEKKKSLTFFFIQIEHIEIESMGNIMYESVH